VPYQNVSLLTLVTLLQNRIQNTAFYGAVEIREIINEAIRLWQIGSLYWKARMVAATTAGLVFYDLTTLNGTLDANNKPRILMPLRVAFNTKPLDFCAINDMDAGIPLWQIQTTATPGAPTTPQLWGTLGLNYLYIWPADAAGGNALQIDAAVRAPVFLTDGSQDANKIDIDSAAISQLLDYAQHVCNIKRGAAMLRATMPKLRSFMKAVATQNSLFAASSIYKSTYGEQSDRRTRPRLLGDLTGSPTPARYR
jgi:hypothetical protein